MRRLACLLVLFLAAPVHATRPDPKAPVAKLLASQLATLCSGDAGVINWSASFIGADTSSYSGEQNTQEMIGGFMGPAGGCGPIKVGKKAITLAADGKSAWLYAEVKVTEYNPGTGPGMKVDYRLSELVAEQDGEWGPVAVYWSSGTPDKEANKRFAEASKLEPDLLGMSAADAGEVSVAELVSEAFRQKDLAPLVSARSDLAVVGSAPGELLVGGNKFKKNLGFWTGRIAPMAGVKAGLSPAGTTAWAIVTFTLDKEAKVKGELRMYQIPFRAFLVLEKGASGWEIVHAHLAIAG